MVHALKVSPSASNGQWLEMVMMTMIMIRNDDDDEKL